MELTKAEELLLGGLMLFPMRKGNIILAMMLMDTEEKRWDLITFLASKQNASEEEIMEAAQKIART